MHGDGVVLMLCGDGMVMVYDDSGDGMVWW